MSYIGLIGIDADIKPINTVVANCGDHTLALVLGGEYDFKHCTFANYWSENPRSKPVMLLSNFSESSTGQVFKRSLNAYFGNSIVHGNLDSEFQRKRVLGSDFNFVFDHVILKLDTENVSNTTQFAAIFKTPSAALFSNPASQDYSLSNDALAIDNGIDLGILKDLKGKDRVNKPDLGAFEFVN
jgi:hypothetical protein